MRPRSQRIKKRLSCELRVGARRYSGLILDLSPSGLFVQTAAPLSPGEGLEVAISAPDRKDPIVVQAQVARAKVVPPQLRTVAHGGIGINIPEPSEEYAGFVRDVQRPVKIPKVSVLPAGAEEKPPAKPRLTKDRLDKFFSKRKVAPSRPVDPSAGPAPTPQRWRVHLTQLQGAGTRSFVVEAPSEAEARREAGEELGDDWKIESIEKL